MPRLFVLTCLICALGQVPVFGDTNLAAVRFAHFEVLTRQYVTASGNKPTIQLTRLYVPKFLALANENPTDEAALRCCEWVIAHCRPHKSDPQLYEAEAICWDMIGSNLSASEHLPALCLAAARHPTPARERFLRALSDDYRQSVEIHGHAYLALAELLEKKWTMAADSHVLDETAPTEWRQYLARVDVVEHRRESLELYQHVLAHYRETPYQRDGGNDDDCQTLGKFAAKRLKQLESNPLARKSSPNSVEKTAQQLDHVSGN